MRKHSLFARLFLIFIGFVLLVVLSFSVSFWFFHEKPYQGVAQKNPTNYTDLLIEKIGTPPDLSMAQKIADENDLLIVIEGPGMLYRSSGQKIPKKKLELMEKFPPSMRHKVYRHKKNFYIEVNHGWYRYTFTMIRDFKKIPPVFPIGIGVLMSFVWLLLSYQLVRRMFKSLDEIQKAAQEFAVGDFSRKLEEDGPQELKDLSASINKMANDIKEILDSKQELIIAVAHELRTPITRAKLGLEMLDDSSRKEELKEDVQEMATIVEDILEAERLKSNYTKLHKEDCFLEDLLNETIRDYFSSEKRIKLHIEAHPEISLDKNRYKIVIKNLISNALRYGSGKKVEVYLRQDSLCVRDYGEGIRSEDLPKIKDAFYRVEKSRTKNLGGIGLGLFLCGRIIEAHEHELHVDSEGLGKGSSFEVRFKA